MNSTITAELTSINQTRIVDLGVDSFEATFDTVTITWPDGAVREIEVPSSENPDDYDMDVRAYAGDQPYEWIGNSL